MRALVPLNVLGWGPTIWTNWGMSGETYRTIINIEEMFFFFNVQ